MYVKCLEQDNGCDFFCIRTCRSRSFKLFLVYVVQVYLPPIFLWFTLIQYHALIHSFNCLFSSSLFLNWHVQIDEGSLSQISALYVSVCIDRNDLHFKVGSERQILKVFIRQNTGWLLPFRGSAIFLMLWFFLFCRPRTRIRDLGLEVGLSWLRWLSWLLKLGSNWSSGS